MSKPFEKVNSHEVYHGKVLNVRVDTVRYNEKDIKWEIVEMGSAVVVMPLIEEDKFVMIHQYRYVTGKFIWEFPAGRAHDNEQLELCAQRELAEECGYRARQFKKVLTYYPSPGVMTEVMHLFIAHDLYESHTAQPDDDEIIRTEVLDAATIDTMIQKGEIQDAKTILAFYYWQLHKEELKAHFL
ncbi:MAG: NUDIX hydrolase, partial [Candidatus Omnitrophota bacterium]